jgi:hypothetical protein
MPNVPARGEEGANMSSAGVGRQNAPAHDEEGVNMNGAGLERWKTAWCISSSSGLGTQIQRKPILVGTRATCKIDA